MNHKIAFNRPAALGNELEYIRQAVQDSKLSGDGPFTKKCHQLLEAEMLGAKALLTTSCTHALEMTAILLNLQPGDEVILPAFTFVSTANAYVLRGAKPVFCDIRRDTLNMDEKKIEALITPRTKGIVLVHYAGVGCEMNEIMQIAQKHKLYVVEDNAHGLFGKYRNKPLGSFGHLSALSFHETKNFSCGEGGALIINDHQFGDRAEIIREKGTDRSRFFRGLVDKYSWVDIGSSYLPSELNAAYLFAQLELRDRIQGHRKRVWDTYQKNLKGWASDFHVGLPQVPAHCEQAYHMYYMLMPTYESRQALIKYLDQQHSISAVFHYLPLNTTEFGKKLGAQADACPVTEDVSDRLIRLPFFNSFSEDQQAQVVEAILNFKF